MRKFKYFIDFDKEEKWLSEMARQGWQLKSKSFGYEFQKAEPEDEVIKIDYRKFKRQEDHIDYCTLFEDSGWEHIAGTKSSGTQYFKKVDGAGDDNIFSDKASEAGKYKRLSDMFIELAIVYIPIFAALLSTGSIQIDALADPRQLYLTQGLWEMTGALFWKAFLFETPFALFRGVAWMFFPVMIILYFIFGWKAKKLYEKHKTM